MADRENVITHLQIISTWASFARERDLQFFTAKHLEDMAQWADDAIVLLKEYADGYKNILSDYEDLEREHEKLLDKKIPLITNGQEIIRCKDCKHRGDSEKCVLTAISEEKDFPLFMLDNRGEWFCADGTRKDS